MAVAAGELIDGLGRMERDGASAFAMMQAMTQPRSVVSPKLVVSGPPCGGQNDFFAHDWYSREGRPPSPTTKRERQVAREADQWTKPLDEVLAERAKARQQQAA